jgi:hypothetical protein
MKLLDISDPDSVNYGMHMTKVMYVYIYICRYIYVDTFIYTYQVLSVFLFTLMHEIIGYFRSW